MSILKRKPVRCSVLAELNAEQISTVGGGMSAGGGIPRPIGHPIGVMPVAPTPVYGMPVGGRPPVVPL